MNTKHTPGPWRVGDAIAAAPDALELAEAFLAYLQDDSQSPRRRQACIQACNAFIAKARGDNVS
jgi:hypothetical protein